MARIKYFVRETARRIILYFVSWANGLHRIRATEKLRYPESELSLHMVTCHSHLNMALWCLKSFAYYAEMSPLITIHDDGTLTKKDIKVLHKHLIRCTVIRKSEADHKMDDALKDHPRCREMRRIRNHPFAVKLFDPWVYSASDKLVFMDSDILFFQRPSEFLNCVKRNQACFNSDYKNSYAVSMEDLRNCLGIDVMDRVNSGLMVLRRDQYDLDLIERYFCSIASLPSNLSKHEQTLYAVLLSQAHAHPLSDAYQISRQKITAATVSHHFVSDGSRVLFATKGIKTLKRRGIFTGI